MGENFIWRDAGRTVLLREGGLHRAVELLGRHGCERFELLATPRSLAAAGELAGAAAAVHEVAPGAVADAAAALRPALDGRLPLVALGGGRVIDCAKALASVLGLEVATLATTMSGAEMTSLHALPSGDAAGDVARTRPRLVIADPELMTDAPEPALRASSMNALAHAADSVYTPLANPVSLFAARRGAELIAAALDRPRDERPRAELALGSLLCGYAIDSALFGLHHVVCQTFARVCGTAHAQTNAAVLPHATAWLALRAPAPIGEIAAAIGCAPGRLRGRIRELGGEPAGLAALGVGEDDVEPALTMMLSRRELGNVPGRPGREDLRAIVEAAW